MSTGREGRVARVAHKGPGDSWADVWPDRVPHQALNLTRGCRVRQARSVAKALGHPPFRYRVKRVLKDGRVSLWGPLGRRERSQFWTTRAALEGAEYVVVPVRGSGASTSTPARVGRKRAHSKRRSSTGAGEKRSLQECGRGRARTGSCGPGGSGRRRASRKGGGASKRCRVKGGE